MISLVRTGVRLPTGGELSVVVYEVRGGPASPRITIETDRSSEGKDWFITRDGKTDPERYQSAEEALDKLEAEFEKRAHGISFGRGRS